MNNSDHPECGCHLPIHGPHHRHYNQCCSCVHPVIICSCLTCKRSEEQEEVCHGHHETTGPPSEEKKSH